MVNWYRITEDVEYSTSLNFFKEHQIGVVFDKQNNETRFFSRLDGRVFKTIKPCKIPQFIEEEKINEIHQDILNGIHGVGKLVK